MTTGHDISRMRKSYELGTLREEDFPDSPNDAFNVWFEEARERCPDEANAMTLATVTSDGQPKARTVLLKGFDVDGFRFFTNYDSHKAVELDAHPQASLLFHWPAMERQVRIEGVTTRLPRADTEAYFATRPRESQVGAWASPQSRTLSDRTELEALEADIEKKFIGRDIPCPSFWGGYILLPHSMEFWQGRKGRLHDRLVYKRNKVDWRLSRLAP
jgi:pyridoxamine 5'-phosphate oxidase